jgi:hypothetical protein
MRFVLRSAAMAVLVLLSATRAQAGTVYDVTGTFGPDFQGTTGLANGSFTATVDVAEPVTGQLLSYSVSVFAADSSTPLYTFGDPTGADGFIADFGAGGIGVGLEDPIGGAILALNFAPGFTGTGPLLPTDFGSAFPSIYVDPNGNSVLIAGGMSMAAVPEPSSLILAGTAALAGLGLYVRRRRS